ncbi:trypsin-like peptidase domain-containing protein [Nocardioides panacisoli]|uniref:FHA domain-containing protein n=1 Tax=Nocardioides panacisoli TaxID=627624 RepID=A0ABP7J6N3_9ACTN
MSPLVVRVDGRVLRLDQDRVIRIGRAIEADIVLTAGSVSRLHAELRPVGGVWVLVDTGSQFGTYVEGRPVRELRITGPTVIRCGPEAPGATLTVIPEEMAELEPAHAPAAPPSAAPPTGPPPGAPPASMPLADDPTRPPPPPGQRPPGPRAQLPPPEWDQTQVFAPQPAAPVAPGAPPPARSGPDLLVVADGREHRFRHPALITVGRQPASVVQIADPACSRDHGRVSAVPGGWVYTNVSNEGTFRDGRRIGTTTFDDRLDLRLGHPVAGPRLTLVPILSAWEEERRIARRRRNRVLKWAGVALAALVAAAVLVVAAVVVTNKLVDGGGGDGTAGGQPELTSSELESAKAAVVKITAQSYQLDDPAKSLFEYGGSGSIIRSDGLILTNAHVAAPEADGLVEQYGEQAAIADPDYLLISVTDGMTDTTSAPLYRARVVSADGHLDVAVIQIYANADGSDLDGPLDLPTVDVGDSSDLRSGDPVTVLGFPGVSESKDTVTVTSGGIATLVHDDQGEVVEFDTTARISPGNSGGMAIDDDANLIGVPTAILNDSGVTSGRIRAIDVLKGVIQQAEDSTG